MSLPYEQLSIAMDYQNHRQHLLSRGTNCIQQRLLSLLPSPRSRVFIMTGYPWSLDNPEAPGTTFVQRIERILGPTRHAGTSSDVKKKVPKWNLDEAYRVVARDNTIDTIVSIGGGSVIDASKIVCMWLHEHNHRQMYHICIPTSLSGAEYTSLACYAESNGQKTIVNNQRLGPDLIIMDPVTGLETDPDLYLSTGLRLLIYSILWFADFRTGPRFAFLALANLRMSLLEYKEDSTSERAIIGLQLSTDTLIRTMGVAWDGSVDIRYAAGYASGFPHGFPEEQRMTLPQKLRWKSRDPGAAVKLARVLPFLDWEETGDVMVDARLVADAVEELIDELGLSVTLPMAG